MFRSTYYLLFPRQASLPLHGFLPSHAPLPKHDDIASHTSLAPRYTAAIARVPIYRADTSLLPL